MIDEYCKSDARLYFVAVTGLRTLSLLGWRCTQWPLLLYLPAPGQNVHSNAACRAPGSQGTSDSVPGDTEMKWGGTVLPEGRFG